jgi:rubrerythrin
MKAKNRCLRCNSHWEGTHGSDTKCPYCGHLYVKWENYEEMRKVWNEERRRSGRQPI